MASVKRIKASDGTGNASVATVQTIRAALATTITVDTVVGIYAGAEGFYATMGTPHTFTDPITSEVITVISDATAVDFQGHIDTGHIIIDLIAPGYTDLGSKVGDIVIIRPTTQWSNNASDTLAIAHNDDGTIKAPQGELFNGVIVPSIASNNLTVAIKTLAGADPSATDPVHVNIGGIVRIITAALSVTLNAGTNWFSKGTAPLATAATNFFVYLGYNATDGVTLGVSSSATAYKYSDFSVTSTNFTYAKISNITHAAATDSYENIGRFNAILGVSATYLWTLPAGNYAISQPSRTILQPNCRFYAYQNSAQAITSGSDTKVNLQAVVFDIGSNFNTSTFLFTAPTTGFYSFSWSATYPLSTNSIIDTLLYVNGSNVGGIAGTSAGQSTGGTQTKAFTGSGTLLLAAGDTVGLYINAGNNASLNAFQSQTYLQGFLLNAI